MDKTKLTMGRAQPATTVEDALDAFVQGEEPHDDNKRENEVTKTFRIPESLGRRLTIYSAQTGVKQRDILIKLITDFLDANESQVG